MVWETHITLDASDDAVRGVSICLDKRELLKQFDTRELVDELNRRPYFNFAEHATDNQIESEIEERGLDENINRATSSDLRHELEGRGFFVSDDEENNSPVSILADKIITSFTQEGKYSESDLVSLLEGISGKMIFKKVQK